MYQSPSGTKIFLKFERLSEDISNSKSKHTQDVSDLGYTKNN